MNITISIPEIRITIEGLSARDVLEDGEDDPLAAAVLDLARTQGQWTGSATELLAALNAGHADRPPEQGWPSGASDLGQRLNRIAPFLESRGVAVRRSRSHDIRTQRGRGRSLTIALTGEPGDQPSRTPSPQ